MSPGTKEYEVSVAPDQDSSSASWVSNSIDGDDVRSSGTTPDCNQALISSSVINYSIHSPHDALSVDDCVNDFVELLTPYSASLNVGCFGTEEKKIMSSKMLGDQVP